MSRVSNNELIKFLRDIATDLEQKKLNESQIFSIGQLYMSMKFFENTIDDEKEMIKFLSLGFYIYNNILDV